MFAVPVGGSGGLSFLGLTGPAGYSRIIIQSGNTALGAGILDNFRTGSDLVVVDDFIYGEPQAANGVPEPGSIVLTAVGAAAAFPARRYRRQ